DFRLYEPRQVSQRLLPTEITRLQRNDVRQACLHNIDLGADRYFLQRHGHLNVARQIGIVELIRVAQAFVRNELEGFPAERMALAGRKVPEGHLERAADLRLQMMHCAGKTVGWEPFRQRVCLEERAIDFLRPGCQNTVQANGVGHHLISFWYDESAPR